MRNHSGISWQRFVVLALLFCAGSATAALITITEFYNTKLHHYVLITDPDEVRAIEGGAAGPDWQRTGRTLTAYSSADDAPNLVAVCRFYGNLAAGGPDTHFFTADPAECDAVKRNPKWQYEGVAFYAALPVNGQCAFGWQPVWRAYNNSFDIQLGNVDPNHRYSTDHAVILQLVAQGWIDEGVVFCIPPSAGPGPSATNSGNCMIPVPGFVGDYRIASRPTATYGIQTFGDVNAPRTAVTLTEEGFTTHSTTVYDVTANPDGGSRLSWNLILADGGGFGVTYRESIEMSQALNLSMQPGETQTMSGVVSGTVFIQAPGFSCSGALTGTHQTAYTFVGIEAVTVPAGTFTACRFRLDQNKVLQSSCGEGFGFGSSHDHVTFWVADGFGPIKTLDEDNSDVTELLTYTQ